MTKPITRSFIIERTHFRNLEDALSIAVPAAQSLGYDTGIFWMRGSVFAATPYALVGLADSSLSLEDESDCFAISQIAAKQLLADCRCRVLAFSKRSVSFRSVTTSFSRSTTIRG